ncbi:MAG: Asr1405/Asl0597 family protein [Heteroscytonema crispum UTEX LB 1556]
MKSFTEVEEKHVLEVSWADRWVVYHRLQQLDIPCWCETNQPLKVAVSSPAVAIQLWSVVRQFTASRQDLISILQFCWHNLA